MLEYTQISKYSHTNTQKWMHIRGTVMVVKIFLQIPSPWHGERPCLNIPHAPPFWSLLSFDNFKRSLTPSFKLKDWGYPWIKTSSHPHPSHLEMPSQKHKPQATSVFSPPLTLHLSVIGGSISTVPKSRFTVALNAGFAEEKWYW